MNPSPMEFSECLMRCQIRESQCFLSSSLLFVRKATFFTSNWKFTKLNHLYWGSLSFEIPPKAFEIFLSNHRCTHRPLGTLCSAADGSLRCRPAKPLIYFTITMCGFGGLCVNHGNRIRKVDKKREKKKHEILSGNGMKDKVLLHFSPTAERLLNASPRQRLKSPGRVESNRSRAS